MSEPTDADELEVLSSGGRFTLTLGLEGHQIWDLDAPAGSEPVATFPAGDVGFESAWARYQALGRAERRAGWRSLRMLCFAAIVADVTWIVTGIVYAVIYYHTISGQQAPSALGSNISGFDTSITNLERAQLLDQVAYHLALGLLAILVTFWIRRRLIARDPVVPSPVEPASAGSASDA